MTTATKNERVTLTVTGGAGVSFDGRLVAEDDGKEHYVERDWRWYSVKVYQTHKGSFVALVQFKVERNLRDSGKATRKEKEQDFILRAQTADELVKRFAEFDPMACIIGWPPVPEYESSQENLRRTITNGWKRQMGCLFAKEPFVKQID